MNKKIFFFFIFSFTLLVSSVHAKDTDILAIKCRDFLKEQETIPMLLMWIDGYMSALSNDSVLNDEWVQELSNHMSTFCGHNPNATILDAIEAMGENM